VRPRWTHRGPRRTHRQPEFAGGERKGVGPGKMTSKRPPGRPPFAPAERIDARGGPTGVGRSQTHRPFAASEPAPSDWSPAEDGPAADRHAVSSLTPTLPRPAGPVTISSRPRSRGAGRPARDLHRRPPPSCLATLWFIPDLGLSLGPHRVAPLFDRSAGRGGVAEVGHADRTVGRDGDAEPDGHVRTVGRAGHEWRAGRVAEAVRVGDHPKSPIRTLH